jgi:hypothetical protein
VLHARLLAHETLAVIQLLPCPACSRQTELPESVSRLATIQCPHCAQQFVVGELLQREFGMWHVIADPIAPALDVSVEADYELADEDIAHSEIPGEPGISGVQPRSTPSAMNVGAASKQDVAVRHKTRRKSKSTIWSFAQVVLGGLAAVPIALLLIWHVIGTDVADLGPAVGRYLPWLVPEKFRPLTATLPAAPNQRNSQTFPPAPGTSGFRRFDDVLPTGTFTREVADADTPEVITTESGDVVTAADMEPSQVTADTVPTPKNSQIELVDSADVFSQIRKTNSDLETWSTAMEQETADLRTIAKLVYGDFIELSSRIEAIPQSNSMMRTVRDQLKATARVVAQRVDVQNVLVQGTSFWLSQNQESQAFSLATIVEIKSARPADDAVQSSGDTWVVEATRTVPFEIRVPKELADSLEPPQKLLLLGTVRKSDAPSNAVFTANYVSPF